MLIDRIMRKVRIFAGCLAVIVLLLFWIMAAPAPSAAPARTPALMWMGETNDAVGSRLAIFVVSNRTETALTRQSQYWLQVQSGGIREGQTFARGVFTGTRTLRPGQTEALVVSIPTNGMAWRLYIFAQRDEPQFKAAVRNLIVRPADRLGQRELGDKFRNFVYGVPSDWINP